MTLHSLCFSLTWPLTLAVLIGSSRKWRRLITWWTLSPSADTTQPLDKTNKISSWFFSIRKKKDLWESLGKKGSLNTDSTFFTYSIWEKVNRQKIRSSERKIKTPLNLPLLGPIAWLLGSLPLVRMVVVKRPTGWIGQFDHLTNFPQEREIKLKNYVVLHLFQIFSCASTLTPRTLESSPVQRRASLATRSSSTRPAGASGEYPNWFGLNWSVVPYRTRRWPLKSLSAWPVPDRNQLQKLKSSPDVLTLQDPKLCWSL